MSYFLDVCRSSIMYLTVTIFIFYFPLIIAFSVLYLGSAFLFICSKIGSLPEDRHSKEYKKARLMLTLASDLLGRIWHGYEVHGIENLPEGPGLLVYYHGALPVDYYFLVHRIHKITGRFCYSVIDRALFNFPGLQKYFAINFCDYPTRKHCVEILKKGNLLGVPPGGLREQNYGGSSYNLIWGTRTGFAQIAQEAKVPIIPVFTQNIREGYRTYGNIHLMRWLYERMRWVFFPQYGVFPVKLRTYIGEPIPYDPNITVHQTVEKSKAALEALRDKHQKIPGSIWRALWERFE